MTDPTRRRLLAGAGALVPLASALPLAALPAAADAALLALCAQAVAGEAQFTALVRTSLHLVHVPEHVTKAEKVLARELAEREDRIADLPARTLHGLRGKVLAARAAYPDGINNEGLAESILDDVLQLTDGGVPA